MVAQSQINTQQHIIYPDSDGQPRADNTVHFRWIQMIYHPHSALQTEVSMTTQS